MGNAASSDSPEVANCVAELEKLKDTSHVVNKENGTAEVNHLAKMVLACTLQEFLALFWEDEAQHVRFLENEIKETNISITPFVQVPGVEGGDDVSKVQMQRTVSVHHPLPIQLPWLPLVIQNACLQTISFDRATGEVRIYERSCVSAIPFCEPIVTAAWLLTEREGALECEVTLAWECEVFWALQGQIEYYSKLAMTDFYQQWKPHADAIIAARRGAGAGGAGAGGAGGAVAVGAVEGAVGMGPVGLQPHERGGVLVSGFWGAQPVTA